MTTRKMLDGECGGPSPMARISAQVHHRGRLQELGEPTQGNAFVSEFLSENHVPNFRMDHLLKEIQGIQPVQSQRNPMVVQEKSSKVKEVTAWTEEFFQRHETSEYAKSSHSDAWLKEFNSSINDGTLEVKNGIRTGLHDEEKWAEEYLSEELPVLQMNHQEKDEIQEIANEILDKTANETRFSQSTFFEFLQEVGTGDSKLIDGNFVSVAKGEKLSSKWAEEFESQSDSDLKLMGAAGEHSYNQDFWKNLEKEWDSLTSSNVQPWLSEYEDWEPAQAYEFKEENAYKDIVNPLEQGKEKLAQGDIPSAVLLFEAAAQQDPESSEAWSLLGLAQSKNENDPAALGAYSRAVELNPRDLSSQMNLAVSYTNETYQAQACKTLQDWIHFNEKYSHLNPTSQKTTPTTSSFMSPELHERTKEMFISAAQMNASKNTVDADVQCGLGILFNLSGDYDKAVDCFKAAIQVRPEDALLWNKLGATLANGNRSEEAVSAYHKALQKSPGFIRCRYNLGISCINLKAYSEAAQHFLTALNFQALGRGPQGQTSKENMSSSIWSSLRLCLSLMNRRDLHEAVNKRDLEKLNNELRVSTN